MLAALFSQFRKLPHSNRGPGKIECGSDFCSTTGAAVRKVADGLRLWRSKVPLVSKSDLSKNKILNSLPERESKRLVPDLRPVSFRARHVLYKPGDSIDYVYFPLSAVVSL